MGNNESQTSSDQAERQKKNVQASKEDTNTFTEEQITSESVIMRKKQNEVLDILTRYCKEDNRISGLKYQNGDSLLHRAVEKRWYYVVEKLLMEGTNTMEKDANGQIPLEKALEADDCDKISALIVMCMDKESVRKIFDKCTHINYPNLDISTYLKRKKESTLMAIFDCMIEEGDTNFIDVYFEIPGSVFQKLSTMGNQTILYHPVVRLLINRKWEDFAKQHFMFQAAFYLFTLFTLTFCVVSGVMKDDVTSYDTKLDKARAVFEVLFSIFITLQLIKEGSQLIRQNKEYFKDLFNILEIVPATAFVATIPMRYTCQEEHWYIFSVGYFFWAMLSFKYAAVFRQTGTYAQILWHILTKDVLQFGLIFVMINLAFAGSFLLALKGDGLLQMHDETSTFWGILFVGLRTMIEGAPIVEYTGSGTFRPMSTIVMLVFLFVTIVIMLNILIAQLSSTYERIQNEAKMNLQVNLAKIITRIENNGKLFHCVKTKDESGKYAKYQIKEAYDAHELTEDLLDAINNILQKQTRRICKRYMAPWQHSMR